MATRLHQTLVFANVPGAGIAVLPHSINVNGVAKRPDRIFSNTDGEFTISADTVNVTVTNTGGAPASITVWLEYLHSIERAFGDAATLELVPSPFVVESPAGGGGVGGIPLELWIGGRESNDSTTPLVVGAIAFDPNTFSGATFQLIVVAANGITPLTSRIEMFNLTDGEVVTSSQINVVNSTTPTKYTANLVTGVATGTIKTTGEKIYELRIYPTTVSDPNTDTCELFKAAIVVTMP